MKSDRRDSPSFFPSDATLHMIKFYQSHPTHFELGTKICKKNQQPRFTLPSCACRAHRVFTMPSFLFKQPPFSERNGRVGEGGEGERGKRRVGRGGGRSEVGIGDNGSASRRWALKQRSLQKVGALSPVRFSSRPQHRAFRLGKIGLVGPFKTFSRADTKR